tara:strand:+ start:89 stop:196 length:108 start_codon:yes stop_codon:yes gene_type:complete
VALVVVGGVEAEVVQGVFALHLEAHLEEELLQKVS